MDFHCRQPEHACLGEPGRMGRRTVRRSRILWGKKRSRHPRIDDHAARVPLGHQPPHPLRLPAQTQLVAQPDRNLFRNHSNESACAAATSPRWPTSSPNSDSSSPTTTRPWPTPSTGHTPESPSKRDAAPISSRPTAALRCDANTNQQALPPHESSFPSCGTSLPPRMSQTSSRGYVLPPMAMGSSA